MNEGMLNEIKRFLGELIKRHDRMIELIESQMTQPVQVARDEAEGKPKTMPKEDPVERFGASQWQNPTPQPATAQTWPAPEQNKPKQEKRTTGAPMRTTKK